MLVWKLCSIMKYAINFECARFLQISRSHETSPMVCHELNCCRSHFNRSVLSLHRQPVSHSAGFFRLLLQFSSFHTLRYNDNLYFNYIRRKTETTQTNSSDVRPNELHECTLPERALAVAHFASLFRFMIWRANRVPEQVKLAAILICENTWIAVNFHLVRVIDET